MTPPAEVPTRGGLRIGRVVGVPVFVSPTWLLFAAFVVLSYGPALTERFGETRAYVAAVGFAVLLLVSVLLHEIGHCLVARAFSLPVRSITITFLAGFTEITEPPQTPAREYSVAVVGPMVSLLLAALCAGATPLLESGSLPALLAVLGAVANGLVGVFNLLPGLPLDGGRVLRAGVWQITGKPEVATRAAAWAGRAVAVVVLPLLLLVALPALGYGAPTLGTALFTGLIGAFLYAGATAALRHSELTARLPFASVAALARPALRVPGDLPLGEAVRRAHESGARGLVVVDSRDRLQAVVSEAAVIATPEPRRPWLAVADVARRLEDGMVLDADLQGEQLLAALRRYPASEYVVEDPATGVVRVLAAADVAKVLRT